MWRPCWQTTGTMAKQLCKPTKRRGLDHPGKRRYVCLVKLPHPFIYDIIQDNSGAMTTDESGVALALALALAHRTSCGLVYCYCLDREGLGPPDRRQKSFQLSSRRQQRLWTLTRRRSWRGRWVFTFFFCHKLDAWLENSIHEFLFFRVEIVDKTWSEWWRWQSQKTKVRTLHSSQICLMVLDLHSKKFSFSSNFFLFLSSCMRTGSETRVKAVKASAHKEQTKRTTLSMLWVQRCVKCQFSNWYVFQLTQPETTGIG